MLTGTLCFKTGYLLSTIHFLSGRKPTHGLVVILSAIAREKLASLTNVLTLSIAIDEAPRAIAPAEKATICEEPRFVASLSAPKRE